MTTDALSDEAVCGGLAQLVAEQCGQNTRFLPLYTKQNGTAIGYFAPDNPMPKQEAESINAKLRELGLTPVLTRSVSRPDLYRPAIDIKQVKEFLVARKAEAFKLAAISLLGISDDQARGIVPFLNSKLGILETDGGESAVATNALPQPVAQQVVAAAKAMGLRIRTSATNSKVVVCLAPAKPEAPAASAPITVTPPAPLAPMAPAPQTAAGDVRVTASSLFFN